MSGSIILPIENIAQQQVSWCWLAVVQQIIFWRTKEQVTQGTLAAEADNAGAGSFNAIERLLKSHTDLIMQKMRCADTAQLKFWIEDRTPVILRVATSQIEHHVVLVRGLVIDEQNSEQLFLINDPLRKTGVTVAARPIRFAGSFRDMLVLMEP